MGISRALALAAVLFGNVAQAQDVAAEARQAQAWPEYQCHAAQEGKGAALTQALRQRLEQTDAMPAAEAVPILEDMLQYLPRTSAGNVQVPYALAWRYQELGRMDDLRKAARRALESPYLVGGAGDGMRALLAQSYADESDWQAVVALLQPMIAAECRPIPDVVRQLLAVAEIKRENYAAALQQFDRLCMVDQPDRRQWMRSALELDCRLNGPAACVERILRYAWQPQASPELLSMLNAALTPLQSLAGARTYLDQAREHGELTADYRVVSRDAPEVEELVPTSRIVPGYPRAAAKAGQNGFVLLRILVGSDGKVLKARVLDSAPPGVFDEEALNAAAKGTFKPKLVDGRAVETQGQYAVIFRIDDGKKHPQPDSHPPTVTRCR